jgi:hypothetical protein
MNQNTVSGDIVDLKLNQMGATQITKLRSNMYIVDFTLENGMEISYVFNITKHDKYFLQRMRPYAMVQGKYANTKEITQFIKEDLRRFRTAEHSTNFEEFVDISRKGVQLSQELENLFLHYNVDKVTLDEMNGTLSRMMMHLEQLQKQLPPVVPEPCRKQKND